MGGEWKRSASQRLLDKAVRTESGCLIWTGQKTVDGYGRIGYRGRTSVSVHRVVFIEWVGPIPPGIQPDHLCHTRDVSCQGGADCPHRACIEPSHLELVSAVENTRRGRSFASINAAKNVCPEEHSYDEANSINYRGRRYCRTCTYRRTREYKARRRATA